MNVSELIASLQKCPPNATVLLLDGIFDAKAACEDTFGIPGGMQTLGANCVMPYDDRSVYILHSTKPDE